jgi:hypothetical protein
MRKTLLAVLTVGVLTHSLPSCPASSLHESPPGYNKLHLNTRPLLHKEYPEEDVRCSGCGSFCKWLKDHFGKKDATDVPFDEDEKIIPETPSEDTVPPAEAAPLPSDASINVAPDPNNY